LRKIKTPPVLEKTMVEVLRPGLDPLKFDPGCATAFDRDDEALQLFWLFCILVPGKSATQASVALNRLLKTCSGFPLTWLLNKDHFGVDCCRFTGGKTSDMTRAIEDCGIGQYRRITTAVRDSAVLDLSGSPLEVFTLVRGVGPKTARFFLLHSRENSEVAVLDTHIMAWIREWHSDAPYPVPKNRYEEWESVVIDKMRDLWPEQSLATSDLSIWNQRRKRTGGE
jgi:thermostable 8-oxoguanine DNA glycosylase